MDNVYQSESYVKSRCLQREQNLAALMHDLLDSLGYVQVDETRKRWQRKDKLAIVCFSDDFNTCGADFSKPPSQWFQKNTVVITDNAINCKTDYTVLKVPDSYWGIFSYVPEIQEFTPQRDLHLSINRGDLQRRLILNEFVKARGISDADFLNYNAVFTNDEPIFNRPVSFEQACASSWLNLVVETYAGDTTITFSEKTFRTLLTPAPWLLFACRNTVEYLRQLGFDVLDDVVDHSYDPQFQSGHNGIEKISNWIRHAVGILPLIKKCNNLGQRCIEAAQHNQRQLAQWKQQWPIDFTPWLDSTVRILNS